MNEKRDKPPWWIFQPTPSAIGLLPLWVFLAAVILLLIFMPLIRWLK